MLPDFASMLSRPGSLAETQDAGAPEKVPGRGAPPLALALGGGIARGWAHIGVLRAFDAAGLKPDIVVGTSVGAVVGGCWAAGRLDELEDWTRSLTKRRMFGLLDFSLAGAGLISGGRLKGLLEQNLGEASIESLGPRFAAIATEYNTGHEIWLGRGKLVEALRASYALPGIFEPVRVGGRWLMDGALTNPVPVSAARALGGRLVVAVNLQSDVYGRGTVIQSVTTTERDQAAAENLTWLRRIRGQTRPAEETPPPKPDGAPGIPSVMVDAFGIMLDRISRSRLAGDPPDLTIGPRLADVGLFDFHRAGEAIDRGREAAERAIEPIHEAMKALA
ncbi:patatin-like phospholipase family protein [Chelatococcus sambhunathii]|uniref:Patatin-like phospholipase family protein n=1 Tax=Chelatococcus sambhunathii TaxID=363953 RepID=A0ABU1DA82_9HYPH|nr:patatin-like phospholipase family protein [Chelatococcus sambhunathii]MDR4305011.1 patatin-like phospholipase family protein [Chelatococcus sambhunathii]